MSNRIVGQPYISVSVICFNQENFIAETLNGILSQRTGFSFEIVVSDDRSTDGTRRIVSDFVEKFPGLIRANFNSERKGMKENFLRNLDRCRGDFIAICDGDDLWTDPQKLQLQVDFLRANEDCTSVFHRVRHESRKGNLFQELPLSHMRKSRSTVEDLLREGTFMPTSSIMFRRPAEGSWPRWFWRLENIVDLPLNIFNALRGDIGYIDETLGIYRTSSSPTAFSARPGNLVYEETFQMYELMIENFQSDLHCALRRSQVRVLRHLFIVHVLGRRRSEAQAANGRLNRFKADHDFLEADSFDSLARVILFLMKAQMWPLAGWVSRKYGLQHAY